MPSPPIHLYVASTTWVALRPGDAGGAIAGEHGGGEPDAAEWARIVQTLSTHFKAIGTVRLVLSARLCRFLVAPWVSDCFTGASIRASVMAMFAGHEVSDTSHHVEIDWPAYGQPVPAVAYPRALVETVRNALQTGGGRVQSTVASVVPVLRRYGGTLASTASALLAYAEDDGITGITLERGRLVQVETLSAQGHGLADATLWLSRKRFAFADDNALHWLGSAAPPDAFAGTLLPVQGDAPASAGHALVAACA
ncbi:MULTISPECIES: hypothetical protein [unclassified Lysobacter]|uniref:hypothetical protein n=1 Tax=unclassified Lysobacter TaxID=2635362 RepID=UPI001C228AB9|nr:hypothetical protein [Lysobacter sp. MMG2]MBU8975702.1 hypothetical protein [Lysobacter sp. MMG2]